MSEMDDYKNTPVSIGELRAEKSGMSNHWAPRDALMCVLREIDNGDIHVKKISIVIEIGYEDGEVRNRVTNAGGTTLELMGLHQMAIGLLFGEKQ